MITSTRIDRFLTRYNYTSSPSSYYFPQIAACKIVTYWKEKLSLFGHERTYRKLTLQDLADDEHEIALRQGGIQAMPGTDAAGRGLVFYDRTRWDARRSHRASMVRLLNSVKYDY